MSDSDSDSPKKGATTDAKESKDEASKKADPAEAVGLASLILIDAGLAITEDNIVKILTASKVEMNAKYAKNFDEATKRKIELKPLIDDFGKGGFGGGGAGPTDGGPATGAPADAAPEPEEEEEKSSSKAGPGLFGADGDSSSDDDDDDSDDDSD
mmetsp:Transcript_49313/g.60576  ORF Transcript_49313/g.60576 Transcript_49313/m.60576 type:complete len:155 (+) Transcript_49313:52-516(+)